MDTVGKYCTCGFLFVAGMITMLVWKQTERCSVEKHLRNQIKTQQRAINEMSKRTISLHKKTDLFHKVHINGLKRIERQISENAIVCLRRNIRGPIVNRRSTVPDRY